MGSGASYEAREAQEKKKDKQERKEARQKLKQEVLSSAEQNDEYMMRMRFLLQVPLFKRLPKDEQPKLASCCRSEKFAEGATIVRQGDIGDAFYVLQKGQAVVSVELPDGTEKQLAKLGPGDYFGEKALLTSELRTATIHAETKIETLTINKKNFDDLGLSDKLKFADRKAQKESAGAKDEGVHEPTEKTPEQREFIKTALSQNENLNAYGTVPDQKINALLDAMWQEPVLKGKRIMKEGDIGAEFFFVIEEGCFEVLVSGVIGDTKEVLALQKGKTKVVDVLKRGSTFGELAIIYLVPRRATIVCTQPAKVWKIDRRQFKAIMTSSSEAKQKEFIKYFDSIPMLEPLLASEKQELSQVLVEITFYKGEFILRQDEPGNTFFMLIEGQVAIFKDGLQVADLTANHAKGYIPYFGERALLEKEKRAATVAVVSESATCLMLDKDAFDAVLGPFKAIIESAMQPMTKEGKAAKKAHHPSDEGRDKIFMNDLVNCGRIGCGGFSTVDLVQHRQTGETYALKSLNKGFIMKATMRPAVVQERDILFLTNSIFIVRLMECYNAPEHLHFLLELCLGGDLYTTYKKKALFGNTECAKYYIAGVSLAFEHLHERKIIYRDLKPENVLLDHLGRTKITDFGCSKFAMGRTYTTCGSPDYYAPEVVNSQGHHVSVDWWALGILLYELMAQRPPFESMFPMQTYVKIEKGIDRIAFPITLQGKCEDLIKALCKQVPEERLCMKLGGVDNLFKAKWYAKFDAKRMRAGTMIVPHKPLVRSNKDQGNFSSDIKDDLPRVYPYTDPGDGWDDFFASC